MGKKKYEELGKDEITLFDAAQEFIDQMDSDTKTRLSQVMFFLLACTEGSRLNMDKVAELLHKLTDGKAQFQP